MEGVKKEESNQLTLSSFEEENRSMHHSIDGRRIVGEKHDHVTYVLYSDFMYSYTMFLQAMTPRRSVISCEPLGQYWAPKISKLGHSLERKREILQHNGCFPKAPNIYHISSHGDMVWVEIKWWENHLPYLYLMQVGDALRWFHM